MGVLNSKNALAALRAAKEKREAGSAAEEPETKPQLRKAAPPPEAEEESEEEQEAPKPKPRLLKARSIVNPPEAPENKIAPAPEPEPEKPSKKVAAKAEDPVTPTMRQPFTLYIDCRPIGVTCVEVSELVAKAAREVEKDCEVVHWSLLDFGKGPGALAAQFAAMLDESPLKGHVCLMGYSPEGRAVMQSLLERASAVVVGR